MTVNPQGVQRVLVIGAGRGGTAMLELFLEESLINIVGIIDADPQAPALADAKNLGIPSFTGLGEAIDACLPCIAFNLTGDDSINEYAESRLGRDNFIGGFQAHFIWRVLTRLKQKNDQVTHLAHHDTLTELPNRVLFYDRLGRAISRARRNQELLAVLFLDLDGFKSINDTLGHDAGDELLRLAARRIVACVRDSDTVARMGGDEFTVILCDLRTSDSIHGVTEKIIEALASPFLLHGKERSISASIGVALYPEHGDTPEQLVKIADAAMYLAKRGGRNRCHFVSK